MNFSEKLKSARIAAGLTQQELAKAVGLKGKQGVNNWESGFSEPNIEKLNLLAKVLNVSIDSLTSDSSLETSPPSAQAAIFAQRITFLRKSKNMSLKQLGDAVGKTNQVISLFEKGKSLPSFEVLCKLADALDVSLDWLTGRTDDPDSHKE